MYTRLKWVGGGYTSKEDSSVKHPAPSVKGEGVYSIRNELAPIGEPIHRPLFIRGHKEGANSFLTGSFSEGDINYLDGVVYPVCVSLTLILPLL